MASLQVRQALTTFLRENQDVFAWSHKDMLGIDLSIIVHKLNISPSFSPVLKKSECLRKNGTKL